MAFFLDRFSLAILQSNFVAEESVPISAKVPLTRRLPKTLETVETDTQLSFIGQMFSMRVPKTTSAKSATLSLTYRGVRYTA